MSVRILLAEDSAVSQKLALLALRRLGYEADVVANGREALAAVLRQDYDLVLMDVEMPEVDGLEATRQIRRELPEAAQPYIVAMTGNIHEGDRERCLAAGMDDYVAKPIKGEELAAALARRRPRPGSGDPEPTPVAPPEPAPPSAADKPPATDVLDPAPLGRLWGMLGSRATTLLPELIDTFFRNAVQLQESAREALARGDVEEMRRVAHTLKSNSASFGATMLAARCQDLEDRAQAGSLAGATDSLAQIAAEYDRARAALEALRRAPQGPAARASDQGLTSGVGAGADVAPGKTARRGTILVVDDDLLNRMLLTAGLEEQGYTVETAEDGGQALYRLRSRPFDVVLLDLLMPEMDGYQVLEQMKSDSGLRHIPVIVISALDDLKSVIRCIEMGATDYLPKSFDPVLLRARVNASLASKRLHDMEQAYLKQVQRLSARLQTIFEGTAMGILVTDLTGRVTESNPALQRMLGQNGDELRGLPFTRLTHPDDVAADVGLFQELVAGGRSEYQIEKRYLRKDGGVVWGRLTVSLVRDAAGNPQLAISMIEDIGERKQAETRLREQQQALAALEAKQRVTVAEERLRREIAELLHGPVQTRLLLAWLRLGDCRSLLTTDPERAGAILDEVRAEIERVREGDVRHASHLLHPSIVDVGLVPAVRSLVEQFERSVPIALQVAPDLAQVDTPRDNPIPEPLRLAAYRVVEEALNNVCRHAHATGAQVSLGFDDEGRIALAIADDGIGFDVAQVKAGLGLGSIGGRVEQFGGTWEITSAIGQGTKLSVLLPVAPRAAATEPVRA